MRVFWSLGYEATSMADLRAALGLTQASLYAAFGNKETLFREAVGLYRRTDGNTTERALAGELSTRDAVHAMLQEAVNAFTARGAPGGCLLVLGAIHCAVENRAVQQHMASLRLQTVRDVARRIRRGQRAGDVPGTAPVAELAAYYATVLHGLSIQARDGASRKTLTAVVNCAMAAWPSLVSVAAPAQTMQDGDI